jgi:hypothetical protein
MRPGVSIRRGKSTPEDVKKERVGEIIKGADRLEVRLPLSRCNPNVG